VDLRMTRRWKTQRMHLQPARRVSELLATITVEKLIPLQLRKLTLMANSPAHSTRPVGQCCMPPLGVATPMARNSP
jgi:hypothetical protein